jgi:hypothetical protein
MPPEVDYDSVKSFPLRFIKGGAARFGLYSEYGMFRTKSLLLPRSPL